MKKKILLRGPVLSRSGYGEQARFALRALHTREDLFDIYVINIPWGATGQITNISGERRWIEHLCMKTHTYGQQTSNLPSHQQFDISLQVTIPVEFVNIAPVDIGYTAGIETTQVAGEWLQKSNETVDKIITISEHSRKVFENTKYEAKNEETGETKPDYGLEVPVGVVNYPVLNFEAAALDIEFKTKNNFLVVSQWGPRKNVDNTIRWFIEEFETEEDVGLVLKTNHASDSIADRQATMNRLEGILKHYPNRKCKVYLVHGDLKSSNLTWLYQHPTMKALINIAHGEGYGLPLFEAAYNGLPLVTVTWGGQMDFICKPNKKGKLVPRVARVDYDLNPIQPEAVWPGVLQEGSRWAFAKEASYKRAIREILTKETHYRLAAQGLQKYLLQNFTEEKVYGDFVNEIWSLVEEEPEQENELTYFDRQNV